MKAYDRKARDKKARAFILNEARFLMECSDLAALSAMHETEGFGGIRLERFYRGFQTTYDGYKRRYLAADDSTILCGDRTDTEMLKRHLRQFGYKYTAPSFEPCPLSVMQRADRETAQRIEQYAIVMREAVYVMEHAELVTLITLHDLFGRGRERLVRYFARYRSENDGYMRRYLAADETVRAVPEQLKERLCGIGFDYDALVAEILNEYKNGGKK